MNKAVICLAAALVTFTTVHSCSIDGVKNAERPYTAQEQIEEHPRKIKQSVLDEMPYLDEHWDDDDSADNSDTGIAETFTTGTVAAVIVSFISWAIGKHKNRK